MGLDHVPRRCPNAVIPNTGAQLERETGFEPATPSLEGWRSTAELFPQNASLVKVVGRGGFEPPKTFASRFTVCPLWPLGYLPESTGMYENSPETAENAGAGGRILNPHPLLTKQLLCH